MRPLPGVLDHREFVRVRAEIGRCDICRAGKAVLPLPGGADEGL
ncbi:MAG: hypothetical protein WAO36_00510 [Candidatus Methanoculleus thermohydrogenotrophicum]